MRINIVLYLLSPYINSMIKSLSKDQHIRLLFLLIIIWRVYPTVAVWAKSMFGLGNNLAWFVTVYVVATYIRCYGFQIYIRVSAIGYLFCTAILTFSRYAMDNVGALFCFDTDLGELFL